MTAPVVQPQGRVTFLLSDIEGSTALLQRLGTSAFTETVETHHRLVRAAIMEHRGWEMGTEGDSFAVAFASPRAAVACALDAQLRLVRHPWPHPLRVRMGVHCGDVVVAGDNYVGLPVHVAARVTAAAWGGQILLSESLAELPVADLGAEVVDLGSFELKDIGGQRLFQLVHPELPTGHPPPRSHGRTASNLPHALTSLIGRSEELDAIVAVIRSHRLVTLLGPGGIGKTRLALSAAAQLLPSLPGGAWWVDLTEASRGAPDRVVDLVAMAVGLDAREVSSSGLDPLVAALASGGEALLVLDNAEHIVRSVAGLARTLLERCPHLRILTTSRARLGLAGERVHPILGLELPPDTVQMTPASLHAYPATALFVERATSIGGHAPGPADVSAVVDITRQVEGLPLAIELAAARTTTFAPSEIATRMRESMRFLANPDPTVDDRQRTLTGAVQWSWDLLSDAEQAVLRRLSAFEAPTTLDSAEAVCTSDVVARAEVAGHLDSLVRHSLVTPEWHDGVTWFHLHPLVHQFAHERLVDDGEAPACLDRMAHWLVGFAEQQEHELDWQMPRAVLDADRRATDIFRSLRHLINTRPDDGPLTALRLGTWLDLHGETVGSQSLLRSAFQQPDPDQLSEPTRLYREGFELLSDEAEPEALEALAARLDKAGVDWPYPMTMALRVRMQRGELVEDRVEALLRTLEGRAQWTELAFWALTADADVIGLRLRETIRHRFLSLGRATAQPVTCCFHQVSLSLAQEGQIERARAVIEEGIGLADPAPSREHYAMHTSAAGLELALLEPGRARAFLEELSLLDDSQRHVPTGAPARARALLGELDGTPAPDLTHYPSTYHGSLLNDALIEIQARRGALAQASRIALHQLREIPGAAKGTWAERQVGRIATATGDASIAALIKARLECQHGYDRPERLRLLLPQQRMWWELLQDCAAKADDPGAIDRGRNLRTPDLMNVLTAYLCTIV